MKEIAKKFYDIGLNIFGINNQLNENNFSDGNILKAPYTKIENSNRQSAEEFELIDWNSITGFGALLGYDSLCAIDIDGVLDYEIIKIILNKLNLPEDYNWVFKSGSQCGYHILLKCALPKNLDQKTTNPSFISAPQDSIPHDFGTLDTNAYYPSNKSYGEEWNYFYKIEFKWKGNIVLPPSLHQSGNEYSFVNEIPSKQPNTVSFEDLIEVKHLGSVQAKSSDFTSYDYFYDHSFERTTSYHLTYSDSVPYNFESKIKEAGLIFHISQFSIKDSPIQPLFMNQISWFVFDSNNNIIKRHCLNYYSSNIFNSLYCNDIEINTSKKLVHHNRVIYHEFLFDLMHVKEILCWEDNDIKILKNEIKNAGLYFDAFLKNITIGEESHECNLYNDFNDEDNLKPVISVKNLLDEYKQIKPIELFRYRFEDSLKKLSKFENKLDSFKNVNSISYLTVIYTLYLILKRK